MNMLKLYQSPRDLKALFDVILANTIKITTLGKIYGLKTEKFLLVKGLLEGR